MSTNKIVHIKKSPSRPPLSPAQKKFNALVKKIENQKKTLSEWQTALEHCQKEVIKTLEPLNETYTKHQTAMAQLLDSHLMKHKFTKLQKEKLTFMIVGLCSELLEKRNDDDIKSLYNKYSEVDYDTEQEEIDLFATEAMKSMFESEFGMALDDDDIDFENLDETAERLFEKIRQREAEAEAAATTARQRRKKTAKQQAKEAREAEEAANVSKSVQAVYRQLASALHPDREQDPAERERKTELMQQVTVAYSNKDLLKLLELQLVVEQIDEKRLNSLSAERLKHYNKVLGNQLAELKEEAMLKQEQIRMMLRLPPDVSLTPKRLVALLKQDIQELQVQTREIENDLRQFKSVKALKSALKTFRLPEPDHDLDPFLDDFDEFLDDYPPFR